MPAATVERSFSEFLRKSGDVLREVEEHDVLLRRRDGADLMLVRADREELVRDTVGLSSSLLAWFARTHARELAEGLPEALPWLHFLPEADRKTFSDEFVPMLEACISLGSFDRLGVLLSQWRNTAYVWSRPELLDALRADQAGEGYDEPVPVPAADRRGAETGAADEA
jgi:hypothetical protein